MTTTQQLLQANSDIVRNGFAIVKGVFSPDEANQMRGASLTALMSSSPTRDYQLGGRVQTTTRGGVEFPALMFWPSLISAYLNQIRTDQRLVDLVTHLIGMDVKQLNNQVYFRTPGDRDSFAWHQDIMFRNTAEYPGVYDSYIQTTIAIDQITEQNSPVEFIVGSHRYGDLKLMQKSDARFREFERDSLPPDLKKLPVRKAIANPGDMILWSLLAVPGSPRNESGMSRMTYMNGFCLSRHSANWPDYVVDGKVIVKANASAIPISRP